MLTHRLGSVGKKLAYLICIELLLDILVDLERILTIRSSTQAGSVLMPKVQELSSVLPANSIELRILSAQLF